jgi:hypothetical protein
MGLHLCYELALPPDTPASDVTERVRRLYAEAVRISFEHPDFEELETRGQSTSSAVKHAKGLTR